MPLSSESPLPAGDAAADRHPAPRAGIRTAVTFRRTGGEDVGQRQIYVSVDQGPQQTLRFGATVTFDVAPGDHTFKVNNTLYWKSGRFTVGQGEHAEFRLVNKAGRGALTLLALFGVSPLQLVIERLDTPRA